MCLDQQLCPPDRCYICLTWMQSEIESSPPVLKIQCEGLQNLKLLSHWPEIQIHILVHFGLQIWGLEVLVQQSVY